LQTIIAYNKNEVKEKTGFENLNSKDKAWIDLIDPTDEVIKTLHPIFTLMKVQLNYSAAIPRSLRLDFWIITHLQSC
jgi:spermidine/putrescine-binding protein